MSNSAELALRQQNMDRWHRLSAADVVDGTVVRWMSGRYTYVALYAAHMWWITGVADFYGERKFTTYDFVTLVLSRGTDISVATEWERLR